MALFNAAQPSEAAPIAVAPEVTDLPVVPPDQTQVPSDLATDFFSDDAGVFDLAVDTFPDCVPDTGIFQSFPSDIKSVTEAIHTELLIPRCAEASEVIPGPRLLPDDVTVARNEQARLPQFSAPASVEPGEPSDGTAIAKLGIPAAWQEWVGSLNPGQLKPGGSPGGDQVATVDSGMPTTWQQWIGSMNRGQVKPDASPGEGESAKEMSGFPKQEWLGWMSRSQVKPGGSPGRGGADNATNGFPADWRDWLSSMNRETQTSSQEAVRLASLTGATSVFGVSQGLHGTNEDAPVAGSEIRRLFLALAQVQAEGSENPETSTLADRFDLLGLDDHETIAAPVLPADLKKRETIAGAQLRTALTAMTDEPAKTTPFIELKAETHAPSSQSDSSRNHEPDQGLADPPPARGNPEPLAEPQTIAGGAMPGTITNVQTAAAGPMNPSAKPALAESGRISAQHVRALSPFDGQAVSSPSELSPSTRRSPVNVAEKPSTEPLVSVPRNLPDFATTLAASQPSQHKPDVARPEASPEGPGEARTNPMERAIAGQVARGLGGAKPGSDTVIVVRLTPPELGTVRIEIRSDRDGLNARLHAEDPAVRESLERLLPTLRGDLRASDSRLTEISVAPQHDKQDHRDDAQQQRSDPDARGRSQDPQDQQRDPHRRRQAQRFRKALDLVGPGADE